MAVQALQQYIFKFAPLCVDVERAFDKVNLDDLTEEGRSKVNKVMSKFQSRRAEYCVPSLLGSVAQLQVRMNQAHLFIHVHAITSTCYLLLSLHVWSNVRIMLWLGLAQSMLSKCVHNNLCVTRARCLQKLVREYIYLKHTRMKSGSHASVTRADANLESFLKEAADELELDADALM